MTVLSGFVATENILQRNRPYAVDNTLYKENPDLNPFLSLCYNLKKMKSSDAKFYWMARGLRGSATAVNNGAGYNSSATSIVVDDGSIFLPGDLIRVYTNGDWGEVMKVTAISTNTLTVVRGYGSTAATALVDNDPLVRIADAQAEFSSAPESSAEKYDEYYNYTQQIITTARHSQRAIDTKTYTGEEAITRRAEAAEEHKLKTERTFILGERTIVGAGTKDAVTTTGGLQWYVKQAIANGFDVATNQGSGTLTLAQWETFLEAKGFLAGSDEKVLLASPRLISVLNNLVRDKIQLENNSNRYGINTQIYDSPHGRVHIVRHRLFNQGNLVYGGILVDPNQIEVEYVGKAATTYRENCGLQSDDGVVDKFRSDIGLKVILPHSCAMITNCAAAA